MFRDSFKYYKSRKPLPDFKDVIDINDPNCDKVIDFKKHLTNEKSEIELGLKPVREWKVYELIDVPGLVFIKNPFTAYGQRYWIVKCLKDYSRKPNKLNLDAHNILSNNEVWWDVCFSNESDRATKVLSKLRWATLGYHHDWDTKQYSEKSKTEMPEELSALTSFMAKALGFAEFKAEAAIVNYYRMNSTLAGHTDHSEVNVEAPLFSISFGQTAIFLIGGLAQDDPASALFLRSGDVVVMSGNSRLRYHGVPKILPAPVASWDSDELKDKQNCPQDSDDWVKAKNYIITARINMNVRQVLKPGQVSLY